MQVVSRSPLSVSSILWRPRSGNVALTVVCKATYLLRPGASTLAKEQDPVHEGDRYWNDDPRAGLRFPSDLVPFKRRAEVLLTGHAYAPAGKPVRSLVARLCVGEVDKRIEVVAERVVGLDGQLREGPLFTKAPLLWHYAAGGPGTANPVGVCRDAPPNPYGQRVLPRLQPPGLTLTRHDEAIPIIGLGPISPLWPERWSKLLHNASGWDPRRWSERRLPDDLDPGYFNAAPADQQLDAIRADERIVLENLHPEHPLLVTDLVAAAPLAEVEQAGRRAERVPFLCDTMWIDADRGVCSLSWRICIPLDTPDAPGRVTVRLAQRAWDEPKEAAPPSEVARAHSLSSFEGMVSPCEGTGTGTVVLRASEVLDDGGVKTLPFRPPPGALDRSTEPSGEGLEPDDETSMQRRCADLSGLPFAATYSADPHATPLPAARSLAASPWSPDQSETATAALFLEPVRLQPRLPAAPLPHLPAAPLPPLPVAPQPPLPVAPQPPLPAAPQPPLPVAPEATPRPSPAAHPLALDRYPIAACARIAASRDRPQADGAAILRAHELPADVWARLEHHWAEAIRREAERGRTTLLAAYDAAYVAQLEDERGPITPGEYARFVVALERGRAEAALAEHGLPPGAMLRIQRVFLNRMATDPAFGRVVREAVSAEAEAESEESSRRP